MIAALSVQKGSGGFNNKKKRMQSREPTRRPLHQLIAFSRPEKDSNRCTAATTREGEVERGPAEKNFEVRSQGTQTQRNLIAKWERASARSNKITDLRKKNTERWEGKKEKVEYAGESGWGGSPEWEGPRKSRKKVVRAG